MKAPTATQQKPPHKSEREEVDILDILNLLNEFDSIQMFQGLGMPTVSGETLDLPAAC
jgi:hypothetical protein